MSLENKDAAEALRKAAEDASPISPLRGRLADETLDAAYAIQEINTSWELRCGKRIVGRKIGLTSASVQRQLGVNQPDYGMLFSDMEFISGEEVRVHGLIQPKMEAEVAFVLGRDLDVEKPTLIDVLGAVEYALPAIEIVDSRIEEWDIKALDTIADNASAACYVLGTVPVALSRIDLERCGMVLERCGIPMSTGAGVACMGNPLIALRWLAHTMVAVGRPLLAGELVLSGALGPLVPIEPGQDAEARIQGLGCVRCTFS
ncbi:MAG: fumarylacetoacetate hydrolase family protein [Myxococcota bacterium]